MVFKSSDNLGKGPIIRAAFLDVAKHINIGDYDYIGFWDADLAVPLWELKNMLEYAASFPKAPDAIWASRIIKLGSDIDLSFFRRFLSRVFSLTIRRLFNIRSYDTQCGAKIFRPDAAIQAFEEEFSVSWIFDVEIYLRLKNRFVLEYPLRRWHNVANSSVNVRKEVLSVVRDLWLLWKKYGGRR